MSFGGKKEKRVFESLIIMPPIINGGDKSGTVEQK